MEKDVREQAAKLAASFRAKGKKVNTNVGKAVLKACLIVEREAKTSMSPNGPSAPGEPPAVDTGRLRASITHRLEGGGYDSKTRGYVGTNVEYGPYLEFGTSRMAARPWLTPALEKHKEEIKRLIKDATVNGVRWTDESEAEE
jgi:HK97 gp10 family phage protein